MDITINSMTLIVSLLFGVLYYFITIPSKSLIKYYQSEINQVDSKPIVIMTIIIYLTPFILASTLTLAVHVLLNPLNETIDSEEIVYSMDIFYWIMILLSIVYSTILYFSIQIYRKRVKQIFHSTKEYKPDRIKYKKMNFWKNTSLLFLGVISGIVFTCMFVNVETQSSFYVLLLNLLVQMMVLFYAYAFFDAFSISYNFKKFTLCLSNDDKLEGYLIGEDENYMIIKSKNAPVRNIKHSIINELRFHENKE